MVSALTGLDVNDLAHLVSEKNPIFQYNEDKEKERRKQKNSGYCFLIAKVVLILTVELGNIFKRPDRWEKGDIYVSDSANN